MNEVAAKAFYSEAHTVSKTSRENVESKGKIWPIIVSLSLVLDGVLIHIYQWNIQFYNCLIQISDV